MGLLCGLKCAFQRLVVHTSGPILFNSSGCKFSRNFSLPTLHRLSHLVQHAVKASQGAGHGRYCQSCYSLNSGPRLQNVQLAAVSVCCVGKSRDAGGRPRMRGVATSRCVTERRESIGGPVVDDGESAFSMPVFPKEGKETSYRGDFTVKERFYGVAREKTEVRDRMKRILVLNIVSLKDPKLVYRILNDWLREYAARKTIGPFVLESKDGISVQNHFAAGRFVPYCEVSQVAHALMKDLSQRGHSDFALEVLRWMEMQGWCQLDPHLYTTVIDILGDSDCLGLAEEIFERLDTTQVRKDAPLFNALLNARGRAGRIDSMEQLLESMKRGSCKPDLVSYNTVMNAYVKAGMGLGTVVGVFKDMYSQNIQPDLTSFNILLEACISGQHTKEAQKIFENLKRRGLQPSVVSYTTLINVHANSGMQQKRVEASVNALAESCFVFFKEF